MAPGSQSVPQSWTRTIRALLSVLVGWYSVQLVTENLPAESHRILVHCPAGNQIQWNLLEADARSLPAVEAASTLPENLVGAARTHR